jgi:hypothetical protein
VKENYLYRALRPEEIEAGYILIPKSQELFKSDPRLDIDTRLPFVLGPTEEYAVRQHQWNQKGFSTRGISTTPHIERAKFYAQLNKAIVKINRESLIEHGIKEYVVAEFLDFGIAVPEDDEVILVMDNDGPFPKEIIFEVIRLDCR